MTSRVRCSCGRVYDPQKHNQCPDCGAESAVESVVVAEKMKPPAPPEPASEPPVERDRVPPVRRTLPWPVFVGAAVLLIGIVFFALHHPVPPPPNPPNPRLQPGPRTANGSPLWTRIPRQNRTLFFFCLSRAAKRKGSLALPHDPAMESPRFRRMAIRWHLFGLPP